MRRLARGSHCRRQRIAVKGGASLSCHEPIVMTNVTQSQDEVFAFLADPRSHGENNGVQKVVRFDTHGAAVFLAGDRVLKVKRAVKFPFLDYSTLERRKAACEAE